MLEWLTVIIVLLIVAVLLDGVRRMRQSRREAIRMSASVNKHNISAEQDVSDYGSELPSGGARVVNVRKAQDAVERNEAIRQKAQHQRRNQLKSFRIPEQVSLNLDQQVPTLMESVPESARDHDHEIQEQDLDPSMDDVDDHGRREPFFAENSTEDSPDDDMPDEIFGDEDVGTPRASPRSTEFNSIDEESLSQPARTPPPPQTTTSKQVPAKNKTVIEEPLDDNYREPELVLVINVMAPKGEQLPGDELLDIVLNQGMRFGSMNIFHRHQEENGDGEILYSMANIVVPGTFDLANMANFATPGVSFFLTLPIEANAGEAFEEMLTTAKIIGARLGGELKDENRSVLTPQTITHYRGRLQEFARKQLSRAPA